MKRLQEILIEFIGGTETTITRTEANLDRVLQALTNTQQGDMAIITVQGEHLEHTVYINPATIAVIDCAYGTDEEYAKAEVETI